MDHFHIRLEARNPDKGHMRAYSIDAGKDLFGHWIVEIRFGRIGRPGRSVKDTLLSTLAVIEEQQDLGEVA